MSVGGVAQPRMEANPNPQAHVMPSPSQPPQQPQPGFNQFTDWSMGFGRIPQQPSFFNPYMGNYNPYPQFGGFGGFPQSFSPFSGGYGGGMGGFPQGGGMMHGDMMYRGPGATGGGPMGGGMGGGFGGFGGFNPMMGGIGQFGGFGRMNYGWDGPQNFYARENQMRPDVMPLPELLRGQ